MVFIYSLVCVIIVFCMFDIVMLLKCFLKEIYVLVLWKVWFSVVFFFFVLYYFRVKGYNFVSDMKYYLNFDYRYW